MAPQRRLPAEVALPASVQDVQPAPGAADPVLHGNSPVCSLHLHHRLVWISHQTGHEQTETVKQDWEKKNWKKSLGLNYPPSWSYTHPESGNGQETSLQTHHTLDTICWNFSPLRQALQNTVLQNRPSQGWILDQSPSVSNSKIIHSQTKLHFICLIMSYHFISSVFNILFFVVLVLSSWKFGMLCLCRKKKNVRLLVRVPILGQLSCFWFWKCNHNLHTAVQSHATKVNTVTDLWLFQCRERQNERASKLLCPFVCFSLLVKCLLILGFFNSALI